MPEPTRVRDDKTGHEYSTYGVYDGMTVLDEPAVDVHGDLLPAKYPAAETPAPKPQSTTGHKATTKES